jgi:hypothetical protein
MIIVMAQKSRIALCFLLFVLGTVNVFPQNEMAQRGSIPEELLRPRRDESPRFPVDTVIGPLGQGQAPREAYDIARRAASALLAGDMNVPVLASVNRVFLESCITVLNTVTPRSFRLGGGREEPDGSYSFLVRFIGREQGITGELFIRLEERRPPAPPPPPPPASTTEPEETESEAETPIVSETTIEPEEPVAEPEVAEPETPVQDIPVVKVWIFEDLILEDARSREEENEKTRHRFDFPPYERIF